MDYSDFTDRTLTEAIALRRGWTGISKETLSGVYGRDADGNLGWVPDWPKSADVTLELLVELPDLVIRREQGNWHFNWRNGRGNPCDVRHEQFDRGGSIAWLLWTDANPTTAMKLAASS